MNLFNDLKERTRQAALSFLAGDGAGDKEYSTSQSGDVIRDQDAQGNIPAVPASMQEFAIALYNSLGLGETVGINEKVERKAAACYTPMVRCSTLLAGFISRLACNGGLRAVDGNGKRLDNRRSRAALKMMGSTAGYGEHTSTLIRDLAVDYCFEGNGLLVPHKMGGIVTGMTRYIRAGGYTDVDEKTGEIIYQIAPAYNPMVREPIPARDVCVMRWPRIVGYATSEVKRGYGFAPSPLSLMGSILRIGMDGEKYMLNRYRLGLLSRHVFNYKPGESSMNDPDPDEEEFQKMRQGLIAQMKTGHPMLLQDTEVDTIEHTPQDAAASELAMRTTNQIGMFMGIPPILLNTNENNWGTGTESFMRIFLITLMDHVNALLDPLALILLGEDNRFVPDTTELLRPNPEALARILDAAQGSSTRKPLATLDELRRLLGLPPEPEGEFLEQPTPQRAPSMGDDPQKAKERTDESA